MTDHHDILLENWCFLRHSSTDFENALERLAMCEREPALGVKQALLEPAVVAYWRPFSGNRGSRLAGRVKGLQCKNAKGVWYRVHVLSQDHVPQSLLQLHKHVGVLRNRAFAHTDIDAQAPQVMPFPSAARPVYGMSMRPPDYRTMLARAQEFAFLVTTIRDAVHRAMWTIEDSSAFAQAVAAKGKDTISMGSVQFGPGDTTGAGFFPIAVDLGPQRTAGA